jgi:8-oxo-dGTP diphosphatase
MRFRQKIQAVPRPAELNRIRVVAAILGDEGGRILISERVGDHAFAGLWEFPGGKVGDDEDPVSALRRELREELGVEICEPRYFMTLDHDYPDRSVTIDFYQVVEWSNTPEGRDGQALRWIKPEELTDGMMLPADVPVIEALQSRESSADTQ